MDAVAVTFVFDVLVWCECDVHRVVGELSVAVSLLCHIYHARDEARCLVNMLSSLNYNQNPVACIINLLCFSHGSLSLSFLRSFPTVHTCSGYIAFWNKWRSQESTSLDQKVSVKDGYQSGVCYPTFT
jgi:hypothetical protein